jgi:hypothetical protein
VSLIFSPTASAVFFASSRNPMVFFLPRSRRSGGDVVP